MKLYGVVSGLLLTRDSLEFGKVGASTRSGFSDVLLNHKSGAFVLAQPGKLRMPQPICFRPLQELNLCDGLRAKPDAFLQLHAVGAEGLEIFRGIVVTSNASSKKQYPEVADVK